MTLLAWCVLGLALLSHGWFLRSGWNEVRCGRMPRAMDFVGVSAVLYFDVGIAAEACGVRLRSDYFAPMFEARPASLLIAVLFVVLAPWLIRAGAATGQPSGAARLLRLREGRRGLWYGVLAIISLGCGAAPLALFTVVPQFWESREFLGESLGPWIILLSLPMYLLAFFLTTEESRTRLGKLVLALLLVCSIAATLAVGQRTLVLLPVAMAIMFGGNVSWRRWVAAGAVGACAAALIVPLFKGTQGRGLGPMLRETVANDFNRGPELLRAVEMSSPVGTDYLEYAGSGYVYAGLYFVPRTIAPFKGKATAQAFTAEVMQQSPDALRWGFGISAVSEALLNFGVALAPLVLVGYGVVLGKLETVSARWQSLQIPLPLAGVWVFGYHLPALLLNFGAMAVVGLTCEKFFACSKEVACSR